MFGWETCTSSFSIDVLVGLKCEEKKKKKEFCNKFNYFFRCCVWLALDISIPL
jgi:hypothetical protein